MQVREALAAYELQLTGDGRSRHTIDQVRRHGRLLATWLEQQGHRGEVETLRHEDIAEFLASPALRQRADGQPRKASSGNAVRTSLKGFLKFSFVAGYASSDAGRLIRRARCPAPRPRGPSDAERDRLMAALANPTTPTDRRDAALYKLLALVGLRIGSAVATRVEDLDLAAGELVLRTVKNGDEQVVFLPATVVDALRAHLGSRTSGWIFPGAGQAHMTIRHARRRLDVWTARAGIRHLHPHALRHGFAMAAYRKTRDIALTAKALGHRSLHATLVYASASDEDVRRLVAG
jgi:integrase/recombinase XerC